MKRTALYLAAAGLILEALTQNASASIAFQVPDGGATGGLLLGAIASLLVAARTLRSSK